MIHTHKWDKAGLWFSGICAVHCLVTPLLILLLPVAEHHFDNHFIHLFIALFVVPVGLVAFLSGYKRHKNQKILGLGLLGLLLVTSAAILPHDWIHLHAFELDVVTIPGSFLLLWAHWKNRQTCELSHS